MSVAPTRHHPTNCPVEPRPPLPPERSIHPSVGGKVIWTKFVPNGPNLYGRVANQTLVCNQSTHSTNLRSLPYPLYIHSPQKGPGLSF